MGLDIAFNRAQALAAGLETVTEPRDPDAAQKYKDDSDAFAFWSEICTYIKVPATDLLASDDGAGEHIVVRANHWGRVYQPLTDWLKANGIDWEEF
jgi:hypothetical protein